MEVFIYDPLWAMRIGLEVWFVMPEHVIIGYLVVISVLLMIAVILLLGAESMRAAVVEAQEDDEVSE
jgi:hypothetical protein